MNEQHTMWKTWWCCLIWGFVSNSAPLAPGPGSGKHMRSECEGLWEMLWMLGCWMWTTYCEQMLWNSSRSFSKEWVDIYANTFLILQAGNRRNGGRVAENTSFIKKWLLTPLSYGLWSGIVSKIKPLPTKNLLCLIFFPATESQTRRVLVIKVSVMPSCTSIQSQRSTQRPKLIINGLAY